MTYDIGTWFVHAVNVDFDFATSGVDEQFLLKALAQRNPKVVQLHLQQALFRLWAILKVYVDERGLPTDQVFMVKTRFRFPDGHAEELDPMSGIAALLLAEFPSTDNQSSSR